MLGAILAEEQQYDASLARYRRAIELDPDDRDSRKNLALLLREREEL